MAETAPDPLAARIARVNELSALARTNWFTLLAYLAFVGVTLLAVEDADFFVPARQTDLPLVGVSIPTARFFVAAPLLGAALYVYLHIHLTKLWEVLAPLRREAGAEILSHRVYPWLVNDFVLHLPGEGQAAAKPLSTLAAWVTRALVWVAGPLVLAGFWWRSMPAHDECLTLWIAAFFLVASYAGFTSWWKLKGMLGRPERKRGLAERITNFIAQFLRRHIWKPGLDLEPTEPSRYWPATPPMSSTAVVWGLRRRRIAGFLVFTLVIVSWLRTEGGTAYYAEKVGLPRLAIDGSAFLARTDLSGVALVQIPAGWRDHEVARRQFRIEWCRAEGIPAGACDQTGSYRQTVSEEVWALRKDLCAERGGLTGCSDYFEEIDENFRIAWRTERRAMLQSLADLDLSGRDLRNTDLTDAFLSGAEMSGVRLDGARLGKARLEGAILRGARLQGANLRAARLEMANLREARLQYAELEITRLEEADLWNARVANAKLSRTFLDGANLSDAQMRDADLVDARLARAWLLQADLRESSLTDSSFYGAELSRSRIGRTSGPSVEPGRINLTASKNDGGSIRYIDLSMALGLEDASFYNTFGDATVVLPPELVAPCHWADEATLTDSEFMGRWRWWLDKGPGEFRGFALKNLVEYPASPPPPGHPDHECEWSPEPKPIPRASPATE